MGEITICTNWFDGFRKISDLDEEIIVELYVDKTPKDDVPNGYFRIIVLMEPFHNLKLEMLSYLRDNPNKYNYIFTYYEDILEEFNNSILSNTPTCWVRDYTFEDKEFSVSSLVGDKHNNVHLKGLDGYLVRWDLFNDSEKINIPKKFFLSSHSPIHNLNYSGKLILGESKTPLFKSQFHIVIENTNRIKNMFTEKLVDCLQTKSIPIYYGCDNIGDFFDINGIFIANSVSDIIDICNSLNEKTYNSMIESIEENYIRSIDYISCDTSFIKQTKKIIKEIYK